MIFLNLLKHNEILTYLWYAYLYLLSSRGMMSMTMLYLVWGSRPYTDTLIVGNILLKRDYVKNDEKNRIQPNPTKRLNTTSYQKVLAG